MATLVGNVKPRLCFPALPRFTRTNTLGFDAIEFARDTLGMELMPHQELILKAGLQIRRNGTFKHRTVIVIMGRQCGKTTTMQVLALWRLFRDDARLIIGTSAERSTAVDAFRGAVELAQDAEIITDKNVRWANGQEALSGRNAEGNAARYIVKASNRRAGRGPSADLVLLDELREHRDWTTWSSVSKTINARSRGQRWCFSNGGERDSVVLRSLRERAIQAGDSSEILLLEWSALPDAEIDDPKAWCAAVPALGRTVPVESLLDDLRTDPAATFKVETLCQQVESLNGAVDPQAWQDCLNVGTLDGYRSKLAGCVDVSPDGRHITFVVAARVPGDRVRVEAAAEWETTSEMRRELPELLNAIKPRALGWFPTGPAASIATDLKEISLNREISGAEVSIACQELSELVSANRIHHSGDDLLTAQILGAGKAQSGDGWRFNRRDGWCDAAYATAGAVHLAREFPDPPPLRFTAMKSR